LSALPAAAAAAIALGFTPYAHQRDAHRKRKRFSVLVWHRRAGKTVFAVMELVLGAIACKKERGRFGYVGPLLKQTKKAAWDYLKAFTQNIPGRDVNESELSVRLPNGATISLYGADNPDALRGGYFDGVVLDEVADMKPQIWGLIVRPMLTDRQGWALFIGTPKGINLFSEAYYAALQDDAWYADMRRARDTGVIPEEELEQAKREMSEQEYAQEFECDFAAAVVNAMIPLDEVLSATKRPVTELDVEPYPKVMGVDVARFGDDFNAIARRRGPALMPLTSFRGLDLMAVASKVAFVATEWEPEVIFVDAGGIGGGPADRLRQLGWNVIDVNFGARPSDERFQNKRAEMWWRMAEWIKKGSIPNDTKLIAGLTAPTYDFRNVNGKVQLESKDDMRKRGLPSPDEADAVACTFAELLPPKGLFGDARLRGDTQIDADYDPWAVLRGGN
jgi:hypothetical protein